MASFQTWQEKEAEMKREAAAMPQAEFERVQREQQSQPPPQQQNYGPNVSPTPQDMWGSSAPPQPQTYSFGNHGQ